MSAFHLSSPATKPISSGLRVYPLRLSPNTNVFASIRTLMREAHLRAVFVISCVGSIKSCQLRMANSTDMLHLHEPHEIVSFTGTFDRDGCHVHGAFSDAKGRVIGGHVMDDHPMIVFTTVEILLAECEDVIFDRTMDHQTGYPELVVHHKDIEES